MVPLADITDLRFALFFLNFKSPRFIQVRCGAAAAAEVHCKKISQYVAAPAKTAEYSRDTEAVEIV